MLKSVHGPEIYEFWVTLFHSGLLLLPAHFTPEYNTLSVYTHP